MSYNFDDLVYDTKKVIDKAAEKTGEIFDYSKKQVEKAQLKGLIKEKLYELGKLCYDMHEKDEDYTGSMKKLIGEIKKIDEDIKAAEDALKTPKTCSLCGAKNSGDSEYCCKCGEKLSR